MRIGSHDRLVVSSRQHIPKRWLRKMNFVIELCVSTCPSLLISSSSPILRMRCKLAHDKGLADSAFPVCPRVGLKPINREEASHACVKEFQAANMFR